MWEAEDDYVKFKSYVEALRVTNDTAERAVKLVSDYSKILTKDETLFKHIIQIVSEHMKNIPDHKKETLKQLET